MSQHNDSFVSNLTQSARDNPLAAALIGAGAVWLVLHNTRRIGEAAHGAMAAAQPLAEAGKRAMADPHRAMTDAAATASKLAARTGDAAIDSARTMAGAVGEAAASAPSAVRTHMESTMERASDAMDQASGTLRSAQGSLPHFENPLPQLQKGYRQVQSALGDVLDRQPLLLGALGIAIGAGVASAVIGASADKERKGFVSDDVKNAVKQKGGEAADKARSAGNDFRTAAGEAAGKVREAGKDALEKARDAAGAGI